MNGSALPGVGAGSAVGLTGLTDAQAKTQAAYAGFDFTTVWTLSTTLNGGYPALQDVDQ